MTSQNGKKPFLNESNQQVALWSGLTISAVAIVFAFGVFSDLMWVGAVACTLFALSAGGLAYFYRKTLRSRSGAFGMYSFVLTILVLALVSIVNWFSYENPVKWDLTKSGKNTLSEQTVKFIKETQLEIKAIHFSKPAEREPVKPLFEDLRRLNSKFEVEYVDPDKEPARAKQIGIKKYNTLQIFVGTRETKIEDPNEEKVLNAIMKLSKDSAPQICALTGHGERSFEDQEAEGFAGVKKALEGQAYAVKPVSLLESASVPKDCDALVLAGVAKALFPQEVKVLKAYLASGGRMVLSYDLDTRTGQFPSGIEELMKDWSVKPVLGIILDPVSRLLGMDMSMPVITTYSKENSITAEFQKESFFPFSSPIDIAKAPESMKIVSLGDTTPKSMLITDLKQLATGQVRVDPSQTKAGPFHAAVAIDGKLSGSQAARNTRLVVFGSSTFANNNFSRYGLNLDFYVNSISWVLEDESTIAIRKKDDEQSTLDLGARMAGTIAIFTMLIIPLVVALMGIVVWVRRRRM